MTPVLWSLAIGIQLMMFCLFFRESIVTTEGTISRVKCGLAAGLFLTFGVMLMYGIYQH